MLVIDSLNPMWQLVCFVWPAVKDSKINTKIKHYEKKSTFWYFLLNTLLGWSITFIIAELSSVDRPIDFLNDCSSFEDYTDTGCHFFDYLKKKKKCFKYFWGFIDRTAERGDRIMATIWHNSFVKTNWNIYILLGCCVLLFIKYILHRIVTTRGEISTLDLFYWSKERKGAVCWRGFWWKKSKGFLLLK